MEPTLTLSPPVYLLLSGHGCWKCDRVTPVITLASEHLKEQDTFDDDYDEPDGGLYVLSNITMLPDRLVTIVQEYCPGYRYAYSRTAGLSYFMNHCLRCGAPLGDFYMHDEPGGAFLPEDEAECRRMVLVELPVERGVDVCGSYGVLADDLVLRHAARKRYIP